MKNLFLGRNLSQLLLNSFKRIAQVKLQPTLYLQLHKLMISTIISTGLIYFQSKRNSVKLVDKDSSQDALQKVLQQIPEFTKDKYDELVKAGCTIVVLLNINFYKEDFAEKVLLDLNHIIQEEQAKQAIKAKNKNGSVKQIVIFQKNFQSVEEMNQFKSQFSLPQLQIDSLFLVKNNIFDNFQIISFEQYYDNYASISTYFKNVEVVKQLNYKSFEETLQNLHSNKILLICYLDKKNQHYKQLKKRVNKITYTDIYQRNEDIEILIINDESIAQKFGMTENGAIYFCQKKSEFTKNDQIQKISDKQFVIAKSSNIKKELKEIVKDNSNVFNKVNIFYNRSFVNQLSEYILTLEVDKNKIDKSTYKNLIHQFGLLKDSIQNDTQNSPLAGKFTFNLKFTNLSKQKIKYRIVAKNFTKIQQSQTQFQQEEFKQPSNQDADNNKNLYRSFNYLFESEQSDNLPDWQQLQNWMKKIVNNQVGDYYESQKEPNYQIYSTKLVGSNFENQILKNNLSQALFLFSSSCFGCKIHGPGYEELAKKTLQNPQSDIQFNRMNNDKNVTPLMKLYPYTPVFMLYRKGYKDRPYIYLNQFCNQRMLADFYAISKEYDIISEEQFASMYENYHQEQDLLKIQPSL